MHVVHKDAHPVALRLVGSFCPGDPLLRCHRLRGRGDQADRPVASRLRGGQFHRPEPAHAQADDRRVRDLEVVEQLLDVGGVLPHRHAMRRDRALPEATQVGHEHAELVAQRRALRLPQGAIERVAVDQYVAFAASGIVISEPHKEVRYRRLVLTRLPGRTERALEDRGLTS